MMPGQQASSKVYRVFGLHLQSDLEIEYLTEVADVPDRPVADLVVRRVSGLVRASHDMDPHFDITPEKQYFHWTAIGAFQIESQNEILIELHDGVSDLLASHALMGLVMSVALELRGLLSLHASGVRVDGKAAVFLGDKGAGKSTTTGAMIQGGHRPISDDLIAVDTSGPLAKGATHPVIHPGFSTTKLYPDSIAALGLTDDESDREIHHSTVKKQKQLPQQVAESAVPVGALFVLLRDKDAQTIEATRCAPHEALQAVLRFTFKARYGETKLGRDKLVEHMQKCSRLVAAAPVYKLVIPHSLERLSEIPPAVAQVMKADVS
ncbi:MAG: hypothetical protein AAGD04_07155 [Pseudomonadota bacterium]